MAVSFFGCEAFEKTCCVTTLAHTCTLMCVSRVRVGGNTNFVQKHINSRLVRVEKKFVGKKTVSFY